MEFYKGITGLYVNNKIGTITGETNNPTGLSYGAQTARNMKEDWPKIAEEIKANRILPFQNIKISPKGPDEDRDTYTKNITDYTEEQQIKNKDINPNSKETLDEKAFGQCFFSYLSKLYKTISKLDSKHGVSKEDLAAIENAKKDKSNRTGTTTREEEQNFFDNATAMLNNGKEQVLVDRFKESYNELYRYKADLPQKDS